MMRRTIVHKKNKNSTGQTYRTWLQLHGGMEYKEANPDRVADDERSAVWGVSTPESRALTAAIQRMDSPTKFRMSASDRKAFRLMVIQGLTEREAAAALGVAPSTAHLTKLRLYDQLRRLYFKELENV